MVNNVTLKKLVTSLNDERISWGVGGSFLLQIFNLHDQPNDLDLWVQPEDMPRIRKIFSNFEEVKTSIQLPPKYHFKMHYYDIEVDFVACFMVKPNQYEFVYNISPDTIFYCNTNSDMELPCTLLEDWYVIYLLLNRQEKADRIREYLSYDIDKSVRVLQKSLASNLPRRIKRDVKKLICCHHSSMQYTLFDF